MRILNINDFFTFRLYSNVCRSMFERHKLMFAFLLCARIMMNEEQIDMVSNSPLLGEHTSHKLQVCSDRCCQAEWRYLLSGGIPSQSLPNPAPRWLSERAWLDIQGLSALHNFSDLAASFTKHHRGFKKIFDSNQPHRQTRIPVVTCPLLSWVLLCAELGGR